MGWTIYGYDNNQGMMGGLAGGSHDANPVFGDSRLHYSWVETPIKANGDYIGWPNDGDRVDMSYDAKIRGIQGGLLYGYVDDGLDAYHCRSDPRTDQNYGFKPCWRSYILRSEMNAALGAEARWKNIVNNHDQIPSPDRVINFVEDQGTRGYNMGSWQIYLDQDRWWNVPAPWHNDRGNNGFADGHAETRRWQDERTLEILAIDDYDIQQQDMYRFQPDNPDIRWYQQNSIPIGHIR